LRRKPSSIALASIPREGSWVILRQKSENVLKGKGTRAPEESGWKGEFLKWRGEEKSFYSDRHQDQRNKKNEEAAEGPIAMW